MRDYLASPTPPKKSSKNAIVYSERMLEMEQVCGLCTRNVENAGLPCCVVHMPFRFTYTHIYSVSAAKRGEICELELPGTRTNQVIQPPSFARNASAQKRKRTRRGSQHEPPTVDRYVVSSRVRDRSISFDRVRARYANPCLPSAFFPPCSLR